MLTKTSSIYSANSVTVLASPNNQSFRSTTSSSRNVYKTSSPAVSHNKYSESSIRIPKPSYVVVQQKDTSTTILSESQFEYPNAGPKVEVLLKTKIGIKGPTFSISNSGALMSYLEQGGIGNSIEMVTDIEHSIIQPLNKLFLEYYAKFRKYEMTYLTLLLTAVAISIFTLGLGVSAFLLLFIPSALKRREFSNFEKVKEKIRTILEKENQIKYLPYNMEWVIQYGISPPENNPDDQSLDGKCIQNATLQLLRVKIDSELQELI